MLIPGAAISAKGHTNPSGNTKGKSRESETKHQKSRPTWLLALEIVTGTMVGTLLITALITTYKRFNNKSSMIIPWKKSGSDKERLAVYIGKFSTLATTISSSLNNIQKLFADFSVL